MNNTKSYRHLTFEQRTRIYLLLKAGFSNQAIAEEIGCNPSTIHRELKRNSCYYLDRESPTRYFPNLAHKQALKRRQRGSKLEHDPDLKNYVLEHLRLGWSPEKIAGRLKLERGITVISHETIYAYLYSEKGREEKLYLFLRKKRFRRFPRVCRKIRTHITNRVGIEERPEEVWTRETFGHWEGDLMMFSNTKTNLITLRERKSRVMVAIKNENKKAQTTAEKIIQRFKGNKKALITTVTLDNGTEFAEHAQIAEALRIDVFFCNPYASYEKGSIENGNRELRYDLPRDIDIENYSQSRIDNLVNNINNRPMKCLGFKTPAEVFHENYSDLITDFVALQA